MAILPDVPGLKVSIVSNGQALTEYADPEPWVATYDKLSPPGQQVSSYVECETDAEFSIKLEIYSSLKPDHRCNCITFWAKVDGEGIGGISPTATHLRSGYWMYHIDSSTERSTPIQVVTRTLKFCPIKKVDVADSARVKEDTKLIKRIGEVVVFVYQSTQTPGLPPATNTGTRDIKAVKEVAEKALKGQAISHGVQFGEAKTLLHNLSPIFTYPDGENKPLGSFRFKYRSRAALQSELIIPRSESPEPVPKPLAQRSQNGPNSQSAREKRLAGLKKEIAAIKAEEGEDSEGPRGRKRNLADEIPRSGRPLKTSRMRDGGLAIDLTDD